jgi:hypothetical protein
MPLNEVLKSIYPPVFSSGNIGVQYMTHEKTMKVFINKLSEKIIVTFSWKLTGAGSRVGV